MRHPSAAATGALDLEKKREITARAAGGEVWNDPTLAQWDESACLSLWPVPLPLFSPRPKAIALTPAHPDDYRIFIGDLGNDATTELLTSVFREYPSFLQARVVMDKRTNTPKGYGFVSFSDPDDYLKAFRDWDNKYIGSRPAKMRPSSWKDRSRVEQDPTEIRAMKKMHGILYKKKRCACAEWRCPGRFPALVDD